MEITLEVPDSFNAMGVTIVYDAFYGLNECKMYARTITREDLDDGKVTILPKEEQHGKH